MYQKKKKKNCLLLHSEVRSRHQLSELRLEGGLPSKSVMPASGSVLRRDPQHTSLRKRGRSMHSNVPTCGALGAADVNLQFGSENRTEPGPLAHDPLEDMNCSDLHVM